MRRDEQGTIHVEGGVTEVTDCNFRDEMIDGPTAFCLHGEDGCPAEQGPFAEFSTLFRAKKWNWVKMHGGES